MDSAKDIVPCKIGEVIVDNIVYRYNADDNWQKWKRIQSKSEVSIKNEIDWFDENVFIDKPSGKNGIKIAIKMIKLIKRQLGFTEIQIKKLLKDAGKVGRGKAFVASMQPEVIEFNVGKFFEGFITYRDLSIIPFRKMLFWNKLVEEINKEEQKHINDVKKNAEAAKQRRGRFPRR